MSRRRAGGRTPNPGGSVHAHVAVPPPAAPPPVAQNENPELFTDPMMGAPLQIFVEKDVPDRDEIVRLIEKHGGVVASAYSTVPYILVDPTKESGQNLFRQYSAKRGKIVLNAAWVAACVQAGQLQTFKTNFAGFKVDGTERDRSDQPPPAPPPAPAPEQRSPARPRTSSRRRNEPATAPAFAQPAQPLQYPAQQWAEHQHYAHPSQPPYYAGAPPPSQWATNAQAQYSALGVPMIEGAAYPPYSAYPGDDQAWGAGDEEPDPYYNPSVSQFPQVAYPYDISAAGPSVQPPQADGTSQSPEPLDPDDNDEENQRGRKRTRSGRVRNALSEKVDPQKLVSARGPPTRSPDPPARVIKSTHGGNLFTEDDVKYLKAYIDYCQNQGLVLSLREICERLAVKAPHHTFYSWRRYCNKHQIRLGAYTMDEPSSVDPSVPEPSTTTHQLAAPSSSAAGAARPSAVELGRTDRSPTPPRALYRSTTGKGIAFTETDVRFLMRFLTYRRRRNPELDMVQFWKDVAERAPHHSRASWMKYWRRHKHELEAETNPPTSGQAHTQQETQQPLPEGPPQKRKRYDHEDDMLLAQYFATSPQGTSDAIFQRFAREHPHHPWKGWQEHHRIHKTQIDHLMKNILTQQQAGTSTGAVVSSSNTGGISMGIGIGVGVGVNDDLQNFGLESMDA
ncbi:BRCA1 carboxy-terminus (BRCT) domain protein [Ceratobasidium sp. AG-Ba]|nr:BRCA1 carboxy-terminus (BRCT) domain protein [Ceratobasidium sp. AG-Ba]